MVCIVSYIMPTRSQRPIVNKLLSLEPLALGSHRDLRFASIDEALLAVGSEFSYEQLAAALESQTKVEVTGSTLYRWRRQLEKLDQT